MKRFREWWLEEVSMPRGMSLLLWGAAIGSIVRGVLTFL